MGLFSGWGRAKPESTSDALMVTKEAPPQSTGAKAQEVSRAQALARKGKVLGWKHPWITGGTLAFTAVGVAFGVIYGAHGLENLASDLAGNLVGPDGFGPDTLSNLGGAATQVSEALTPPPDVVPPPPDIPPSDNVVIEKPHFPERVVPEAVLKTVDPTAQLNLEELSKYATKTGTIEVDGKMMDVWQSTTHAETYYLPHQVDSVADITPPAEFSEQALHVLQTDIAVAGDPPVESFTGPNPHPVGSMEHAAWARISETIATHSAHLGDEWKTSEESVREYFTHRGIFT